MSGAEALVLVSIIANVVALVDFSIKIYERAKDFEGDIKDVPKSFRDVKSVLDLVSTTLRTTKGKAESGELSEEKCKALQPVLQGCQSKIAELKIIFEKFIPADGASKLTKGWKTLSSLSQDRKIKNLITTVLEYVQVLSYHHVAEGATSAQVASLKEAISKMAISAVPSRKPCFLVRYPLDDGFIGREDIMEEIRQRFLVKNRVAISGIGGVGKSRIAIQYCYQYQTNNPESHVFWVHCSNKARFEAAYQDIARTMNVPGFDDPTVNTLRLVSDWLSDQENGSWLIVLDNADNAETWIGPTIQGSSGHKSEPQDGPQQSVPLIDYVPRGSHGFILITTRDSQLGKSLAGVKKKPIEVFPFKPEEAEDLLRSKLSEDDEMSPEDASEVTKALDYLPLAITQAAAYLDQMEISVADYLQLFRTGKVQTADLLMNGIHDVSRDYEIQNSVFQTWKISFDLISKQVPRAAELLSLMAMLDRQAISENLLRQDDEPEFEFIAAIQKLKAFSLITKEIETSTFSMHSLVQLSIQRWLEYKNELLQWQEAALYALWIECPTYGWDYVNWVTLEAMSPHIQVVVRYHFSDEGSQLRQAKILDILGTYNSTQGRYAIASQYCSESLTLREKHLGLEHQDTLTSMNNLAIVLSKQCKYHEAEEMHRRTMNLYETLFEKEHRGALASMHNLASVLHDQGRYDEAEEMHRRVLKLDQTMLGNEHPQTLQSMHSLASVLHDQGRYDEAEEMHRRALKLEQTVLGEQHSDTLITMNNLATALNNQSKYDEAEELLRRALKLRVTVLGEQHHGTLMTMRHLVETLREQGKDDEATELEQQFSSSQ